MICSVRNHVVAVGFSMAVLCALASLEADDGNQGAAFDYLSSQRWVSSTSCEKRFLCITLHDGGTANLLTKGKRDHKPVWSKTGDRITFFRATKGTDLGPFPRYKSHICVVNADGSGERELTSNEHANLNPTWTRDGSNRIIFNRFHKGGMGITIYWISPDGEPNSEERLTGAEFSEASHAEWAESGLEDGRIFIWRLHKGPYFKNTLTPNQVVPGIQTYHLLDPATSKYTPVDRPNKFPVHKLSVSPSETKVVYMKDLNGNPNSYQDCVIAFAELDLEGHAVKNEVVISPDDRSYTDMYPRWSPDEKYIIYSSSRAGSMQQYMYSLESGETELVTDPKLGIDQYPCFENLPK